MALSDDHFEAIRSGARHRMHWEATVSLIGNALRFKDEDPARAFDLIEFVYGVEKAAIEELHAADIARITGNERSAA